MKIAPPDGVATEQWTLIRRARQLLTLRGPSGPRRGSALGELGILGDGAVLIRNGVVEEAGPSRRVENLARARNVREIDVAGRMVMPAFVDPDAAIAFPAGGKPLDASKHDLAQSAGAAAADLVRSGVLTVGAHTGFAANHRDTLRILRIHQALQSKPLRIRSIFSPHAILTGDKGPAAGLASLTGKWLQTLRQRKLASILEFHVTGDDTGLSPAQIRRAAMAGAGLGWSIRLRSGPPAGNHLLELAAGAGAVAFIAPPGEPDESLRIMATMGCVHVLPLGQTLHADWRAEGVLRREIEAGIPVAIGSGEGPGAGGSVHPQFLLYLAVERCGMTPEEAIVCATYNAACSLRMSHVTGSLEPGKSADLLVMDVADYRDLELRAGHHDVHLAMRAGNTVYRRGSLTPD